MYMGASVEPLLFFYLCGVLYKIIETYAGITLFDRMIYGVNWMAMVT